MKPKLTLSLLLLAVTILLNAQNDTTASNFVRKFRFDITGAIYSQQLSIRSGETATDILVPDYLKIRRAQEPELAAIWGIDKKMAATDNPMGHGASFFRFHTWYQATPNLELYGSLEINNGGFSWGPYNTYNIAVLPRYYVKFKSKPLHQAFPLHIQAKIGSFENFRDFEGLTLYNLDMQGLQGALVYKKLKLETTWVSDLQNTIGLNIDGTRSEKLKIENIALGKKFKLDAALGYDKYLGPYSGTTCSNLSVAIHRGFLRLYGQFGYRFNDPFQYSENTAMLAGTSIQVKHHRLKGVFTFEYRRYNKGFNAGFRNESKTHYRNTEHSVGSNFTGAQLYPISYNNRPFSQWAVFTEYNEKSSVYGYTTWMQTSVDLTSRWQAFCDLDFNWIKADDEPMFLYPFYKAGVKITPLKGTYMNIYLTNRTLNLDKHYTSYYALKNASYQIEFLRDLVMDR